LEAASQPAALVTRSWVGRVRVVGSADVIDAFVAWQKKVRFAGSTLHRDSNEAAPSGAVSVLTAGRLLGWALAEASRATGWPVTTRRMLRCNRMRSPIDDPDATPGRQAVRRRARSIRGHALSTLRP